MPEILIEVSPLISASSSRVTLRACSIQDDRVTALNGVRWWPAITRKPVLSHQFFDGAFTGDLDTGGASLEISMSALKRLDAAAPTYRWAGAPIKLYAGNTGDSWPWPVIFEGEVERFDIARETLKLESSVIQRGFEELQLPLLYAGTGGAEGPADLKNKPKPLAMGYPKGLEPVQIDVPNSVYQVSGYGPVQNIVEVFERAASFGASVGNYGSYAALVAATIPPGRWGTCLALGMFRLGAPPAGVITCDVQGDNSGGWHRLPGAVITRLAAVAGISGTALDATSLAALDAAVPYPISLYLDAQASFLAMARAIARSCNGMAGVSWTGKLFVSRVSISAPGVTLEVPGLRRPATSELTERSVSPPFHRIELLGEQCFRPHRPDEIAYYAELVEQGAYDPAKTYREGNIVTLAGARWLYINPTPTAGNAPPTWPTASNSYWENLAPPAEWGDITGGGKPADNATRNVWRGIHNPALAYLAGDGVSNATNDISYIAKSDVPTGIAVTNTAYWDVQLVSGGGAAGVGALSARLTNSSITVPTAADGSGGNYSGLTSQVEFYDGTTRVDTLGLVTFALVGSPAWASVSSGGAITINDWGATRVELKVDATYDGVTLRLTQELLRGLQGTAGPAITMTGGGGFEYVDGVAVAGQTRVFAITRQNASGVAAWTTEPPGITLTGSGDSRTLAVADMGANRQVTVRATVGAVYDEDTAIRIDRSTAQAGATVGANELPLTTQTWQPAEWSYLSNATLLANSATGGWGAFVNPSGRCLSLYAPTSGALLQAVQTNYTPLLAATKIWLTVRAAWGNTTTTVPLSIQAYWYDAAGGSISNGIIGGLSVAGAPGVYVTTILTATPPAGATHVSIRVSDAGQPSGTVWRIDTIALSRQQPGADITGENTANNTANVGGVTAAVLVADAATAKANAATALADLAVIASDSYLARVEKPAIILQKQAIDAEIATITARATALGLTGHASYTAWTGAKSALDTYLGGLSPAWNNVALDTAIVAATFRGKWADYYFAREALYSLFLADIDASATTAYNEALAARAAADSKIVFFSETPPGSANVGESWYKPSTKQWSIWGGSAWIALLGTFAGVDKITGANIAAMMDAAIITDAYIANLHAAKITAGEISADRINIDGITLARSGTQLVINIGGVATPQIALGAVTGTLIAVNGSTLSGSLAAGASVDAISVAIASPTGSTVRLDIKAISSIITQSGAPIGTLALNGRKLVRRQGGTDTVVTAPSVAIGSEFFIDTPAAGSPATYLLQMSNVGGWGGDYTIQPGGFVLLATELKR